MTDMTIAAIHTSILRVPWPQTPWLKGHAFGDARNLLVLDVETKGGIVGMGYLFSFRPGLHTIAAALKETILPRVIGKDATAVEGIWNDLWRATVTYNRGGVVTMAMSVLDVALWDAVGKARWPPVASAMGTLPLPDSRLWQRLFPRLRRRRNDREGAALQIAGL
jgi:L-alanine-DL-glutamate epimerase-like enolase superfamily enzyme